jgi:hypothetical protein
MKKDARVAGFVNILVQASRKKEQKQKRRRDNDAETPEALIEHTRHCLETLVQKLASFQTALDVWNRQVWPGIVQGLKRGQNQTKQVQQQQQLASSSQLVILPQYMPQCLAHVFTQLLRLHDALILIISGECRHPADVKAPKPFTSRLTRHATRTDGYTQLYKQRKGVVYSGASMDEWFDTHHGLAAAWQHYFGSHTWHRLLERHEHVLEGLLSHLETSLQQCQDGLQALRSRLVRDVQALYPSARVSLSTADFMEKWTVAPLFEAERRGSQTFQWKRTSAAQGVLPQGWTAEEWRASLEWTPPSSSSSTRAAARLNPKQEEKLKRRRRRVLEDDDDDDNDEATTHKHKKSKDNTSNFSRNNQTKAVAAAQAKENQPQAPAKAQGLRVTTKMTANSEQNEPQENQSTDHSLDAIKEQMGVDTRALQQAREGLEREEAVSQAVAAEEETKEDTAMVEALAYAHHGASHRSNDDDKGDSQARRTSVQRVQGLARQYQRIQHRQISDSATTATDDLHELWDVRECLRQALMEAGNVHLWSMTPSVADACAAPHGDSTDHERTKWLERADTYFTQAVALVQAQAELQYLLRTKPSSHLEGWSSRQRSLHLVRAHALANRGIVHVEKGHRLAVNRAVAFFDQALEECRAMQQAAQEDRDRASDRNDAWVDATVDIGHAMETEALALRWKAEAVWNLGRKTQAVALFAEAGNVQQSLEKVILTIGAKDHGHLRLLQTMLLVRTESYNAWVRLIDLLSIDVPKTLHATQSPDKWEWVRNTFKTAFAGAMACSLAVHRDAKILTTGWKSFVAERDVLGADELRQAEEMVLDNLTRRLEVSKQSLRDTHVTQNSQHCEESRRKATGPDVASRWLLTGSEGDSGRQRQARQKRYGAGYSNIRVPQVQAADDHPAPAPKQMFRKWGDELFPKRRDDKGDLVPDFPFPFRAPEMPAAIRTVLERNGTLPK